MTTLTVHGSRGSYPVSGPQYHQYGGNTPCISLATRRTLLVFDAGTGLGLLGDQLARRRTLPPIALFFTHFHLDHVIGIPSFKPLFRRDARITIFGSSRARVWLKTLRHIMRPPYWPIDPFEAGAKITFKNLPAAPLTIDGVRLSWRSVSHPQGCLSFRMETPSSTVVLATDSEHGQGGLDAGLVRFCRGADLLIHDAQFTPEEYPQRRGWGHSTWEQAARTASAAQARSLVLTSHDPCRSDQAINEIVRRARRLFPKTRAAHENLTLLSEA